MAYNFFDTGGAKASNVLSPDLFSQALSAYDANKRRPSSLEADIARNRQAAREAELAEQDARMMQQYNYGNQQYGQQQQQPMQQPMQQQPMQQQQQPMQQPMQQQPMQQQQQPMQQQPENRPPLDLALRMSKARGVNPQIIEKNGQSYYTTMFGEYPVGPAAPTAFQKGLNDLSIKAIGDIDAKYPSVVESLSEVRSMVELSRAPEFDKAFSSAPGQMSRSVGNWFAQNFGDAATSDVRTQFLNKADKLVMGMTGDIKGSLTNRELSFLQRQKPNANDSPREIRSKLDNIMTTYNLSEQRLAQKRSFIEQGYSPIEASKMSEQMISRDEVSRESKDAVYGETRANRSMGEMISQEMNQEEGQDILQDERALSDPSMSLMDMLIGAGNAASFVTKDVPQMGVDIIGDLGSGLLRGGLQGAHNVVRSIANAPLEAIDYMAGTNIPKIQPAPFANPDPESTAQRYGQNVGQFASEMGVPSMVGLNAVGGARNLANASNMGPAVSAALQALAGAGAGGLEGALLNEGNRGMGAAVGTSLGAIGGLVAGGMDYANRIGKSTVAKNIAAEAVSAKKFYGDKINDVIVSAEAMGADKGLKSVKIPDLIGKEFSNEMFAVKSFNKNKTIESGQKALSNVGDVIRDLEGRGSKPGSLDSSKLEKAISLQASLRANIGNALERANVPGGSNALFDALSEYRENVIPLTKNPAVATYLKSKKTAVDAKRMIESILKDDKAMEMLMSSNPELRNIKNLRGASDLLGNAIKVGAVGGGLGMAGKTAIDMIGDQ